MIAYVDASALLRHVLREHDALDELLESDGLVSSELMAVECFRTLDRLRQLDALDADEAAERADVVRRWLEAIDLASPGRTILRRASEPLPTPLGTLDALHLATALMWRDRLPSDPVLATHDVALARAARAYGFAVIGV